MAITRTWIGGGNNKASNPNDWSPTGVPQPGDTLQQMSGQTPLTMNVSGNDLAGDTLDLVGSSAPFTMNMSDKAVADVSVSEPIGGDTYNLTQQSTLNSTVLIDTPQVINISGSDHFSTSSSGLGMLSVNVASSSTWTGSFSLVDSTLTASGGSNSVFINDGSSELFDYSYTVLNLPVLGDGSFSLVFHGFLTFGSSVGVNQSVSIAADPQSYVVIDHPKEFLGSITLGAGPGVGDESIDLMGLAKADSYTFKNDMLSIFSGNTVIDKLRLTDDTPYGFAVEKETGSVNIVAYSHPTNPPVGLPIHI